MSITLTIALLTTTEISIPVKTNKNTVIYETAVATTTTNINIPVNKKYLRMESCNQIKKEYIHALPRNVEIISAVCLYNNHE
jgi:hypothetical protein